MRNTNEVLDFIMENKNNYYVTVDNDSVWVSKKSDDEFYISFDKFGYHLLVDVFNYFGIEADYC